MVQRRQKLGLALEPRQAFPVFGELLRKNFDRDIAIELGVPSTVYLAHATFADWLEDLVVGEARSGGEGHRENLPFRRGSYNRVTVRELATPGFCPFPS